LEIINIKIKMEIKLNESQLSRINQVLNELPIKEINKVKAILSIIDESNQNKNESNKKN
tara:strand:- start:11716 stop:11892 length:177 start_codon:yes stop_codon:yes gene_type:complete